MMDYQSLYPVVHDLTDIEYSSSCCDLEDVLNLCHFNDNHHSSITDERTAISRIALSPKKSKRLYLRKKSAARDQEERLRLEQLSLQRTVTSDSFESLCSDAMIAKGQAMAQKTQSFDQLYVRTRQIACGSSSTVWETVHRRSGMRFATKIMDRRPLTKMEDSQVYKEAGILAHVTQGHARLRDFLEEPTHFYLVLDYYECGNLQSRLEQEGGGGGGLTEDYVRDVARSLLQCMHSIHKAGVCHRDVKLSNILISSQSQVVLCDFGLAERLHNGEKLSEQAGTPSFVAPELILGNSYDTQADLWSVGVVLYACLVGYLPFVNKTNSGLLKQITKGDYRLDSKGWSRMSKTARSFISQLLQVDPTKRPTAEQALQHAWFASSPECLSTTLTPPRGAEALKKIKSSFRNKQRNGRRRVWFARGGRPDRPFMQEAEETESICSHTLSSVSTADICNVAGTNASPAEI